MSKQLNFKITKGILHDQMPFGYVSEDGTIILDINKKEMKLKGAGTFKHVQKYSKEYKKGKSYGIKKLGADAGLPKPTPKHTKLVSRFEKASLHVDNGYGEKEIASDVPVREIRGGLDKRVLTIEEATHEIKENGMAHELQFQTITGILEQCIRENDFDDAVEDILMGSGLGPVEVKYIEDFSVTIEDKENE